MQCQDCDAKDQVTIAGKTFCANCGTPTLIQNPNPTSSSQPATANNPISSQQPVALQTDSSAIANPTNPSAIADELTNSLRNKSPIIFGPQQKSLSQPTPVSQNNPKATPPTEANPTNKPFQANQAATNIPTQTDQPSTQITKDQSSTPLSNLGGGEQNSEFTSLDNKEESVFSDTQLKELADMPNPVEQLPKENIQGSTLPVAKTPQVPSQTKPPINTTILQQTPSSAPAQVKPMQDITASNNQSLTPRTASAIQSNRPPSNGQYLSSQPSTSNTTPNQASYLSKPPALPNVNNTAPSSQNVTPNSVNTNASIRSGVVTSNVAPVDNKSRAKSIGGKAASVGLTLTGLVLLGVYVWQINYPNLALKVASSKAGINASLPAYMPSGWKVSGDIQSNPGSVVYEIKSPDGSKTVSVNEDRTDWDSQALAENYLSTKTKKYTTLQSEGLTIYVYGNNQASWINHGTWYRIEGNHGLTQDQIIKMATSL